MQRLPDTDLSNWRKHPYSQWAFQHVRELIPTASISTRSQKLVSFSTETQGFSGLTVDSPAGECRFDSLLEQSDTDGLMILHKDKIVTEWHAPHFLPNNPHILFSVSKSVTAMLAGILEAEGYIDSNAPVIYYLPGAKNSVYGNCTLRHVLDMTVALDFEENYTDKNSEYIQYRIATGWNPMDQNNPSPALEELLYSLRQLDGEHGYAFRYRSPNTDLLGLVLERAVGSPLAELFSQYLWQPMAAESDGYITVDRCGAGRAAGGICITLNDFARIGQLFLDNGEVNGKAVLPQAWIEDTCNNGDQKAWDRGNYANKLPEGNYRSQWYQVGDNDRCIAGRGIHGQLLYINPTRSIVIARFASQPDPLNELITKSLLSAFDLIAKSFQ